jgi:hypothetical protein
MREWFCKLSGDAVTVASQFLPNRQESLNEFKKYLNELLGNSPAFGLESNPSALKEWQHIWKKLLKNLDRDSSEEISSFRKTANHYKRCLKELEFFQNKYSEFIENSSDLNIYIDTLTLYFRIDSGYYEFAKNLKKSKKPYYQAKAIKDWLKSTDENVIEFVYEKPLPKTLIERIRSIVYAISLFNFSAYFSDAEVKEKNRPLFRETIVCIDKYLKKFREVQGHLFENLSTVPSESDGQPIYFNLNSAEGKAIQRLSDIYDSEKWVVAVNRDEEINLEELDIKIRESGYLV